MRVWRIPVAVEQAWVTTITALWMIPLALFLLRVVFPPIVEPRILAAFALAVVVLAVSGYHAPFWYWRLPLPAPSVYRRIGVQSFGRVVMGGSLWNRRFAEVAAMTPSTFLAGIPSLMARSCNSERIHFAALVSSLPFIAMGLFTGRRGWALYFAIANIPFNVYPVLLQQYTRVRMTAVTPWRRRVHE